MQEGLTGAGMFVALADRGFFDSFKEANALAHHLKEAHAHSDSVLLRDLASGHDRPFGMTASPEEVEQSTVAALGQAVAVLEANRSRRRPRECRRRRTRRSIAFARRSARAARPGDVLSIRACR